jgi:hypothetical protein
VAVAIWAFTLLWIAIASGQQHDYVSYVAQWKLALSGANPWSTDNAYGPLHNVLAFFLVFGPLGPKVFVVATFLTANVCLIQQLYRTGGIKSVYGIFLLAVPTNFLVVSMAISYGLNDALVAALVIFAIIARYRNYPALSGCMLGLAVLLKYYPIVLVPAFAFGLGRDGVWRLVMATAVVVIAGFAISTAIWGPSFLTAVRFASGREPKLLSILAALNTYPNLVGGQGVVAALVRANSLFVAAATALSLLAAWKTKASWLEASVICLLVMLTAYKVGHQQFMLTWLVLVAALPLLKTPSATCLSWICLPFVLFLSIYQWGYAYGSDQYRHTLGIVRSTGGFVAFTLAALTIAAALGFRWSKFDCRAKIENDDQPPARSTSRENAPVEMVLADEPRGVMRVAD